MPKDTLTAERLRLLVNFDPGSGVLTSRRTGMPIGAMAGGYGRLQVQLDGVAYYAHRLAWLHHYGEWPEGQVDHINGDRNDNRISNLRTVPGTAENKQNQNLAYRNNRSGRLGVSFDKRSGKYRARIMVDGKSRSLGTFATAELASEAYRCAKAEMHPYWAGAA